MASSPPPLSDRPELPAGVERPPLPPRTGALSMRPVPLWAPIVVFLGGVVPSTIVVAALAGDDLDDVSPGVIFAGGLVQSVGWFVISYVLVRATAGAVGAGRRLGLRPTPVWKAIGWAVAAYVTFWIATGIVGVALGEPDTEQQLVEDIRGEGDLLTVVAFGVMVTVLAPLSEEIFFRGLFFGSLRDRIPAGAAAVIVGLVFGALHTDASIQGILLLSVLGVLLCLLYHVTGSLLPSIALHSLHNSISFSYTKGLPWWGYVGVIVASVLVVIAVGAAAGRFRAAR